MKLEVAAIIDGCTRKIIGIRAFAKRPSTNDLVQLIDHSIKASSLLELSSATGDRSFSGHSTQR